MILRRVIEHVKAQNWFAVAIDFVIVVTGVFIGIQVSNWNAARGDRVKEAAYLTQLVDDMTADLGQIDRVANVASTRMAVIALVLDQADLTPPPATFHFQDCAFEPCSGFLTIEPKAPFSSDHPAAANDALSDLRRFNPVRHTYDALISTGDIGLLRNGVVRRNLQAYYANAREVEKVEERFLSDFHDLRQTRHEFGIGAGGASLDDLVEAAKTSPKFAAQLRSHWVDSGFQIRSMNHARDLASDLISGVEAENQ
ncbi:MAG: DUF6090 family protein [Parvularculaceae bacterium]